MMKINLVVSLLLPDGYMGDTMNAEQKTDWVLASFLDFSRRFKPVECRVTLIPRGSEICASATQGESEKPAGVTTTGSGSEFCGWPALIWGLVLFGGGVVTGLIPWVLGGCIRV